MSNNRSIPNDSVDNGDAPLSPRSQWLSYIASLTQNQNQNQNNNNIHNQNPFMAQIENPNQTLEQAFSRLSVANPNPNQSFGYGVANNLNDYDYSGVGVSVNPYYNYNYGIQLSNPSQPDFNTPVRNNNNLAYGRGRGISPPSPRLSSYDVNQIRYNHLNGGIGGGGYGYGNDMFYGSEELIRNFQCALRNESSVPTWVNDAVNVNNVNGMNAHWFDEFRGRVYSLAKDTHGSKILQEVMANLGPEGVSYFFLELINHMCELMVDPIGYEVITKMVEVSNQDQKTQIVLLVTHHGAQFIRICLSLHGYIFNNLCFLFLKAL